MSICSKPGCAGTGVAVLAYDYADRLAVLEDADPTGGELSPHLYLLCARCAGRLTTPRGWTLDDNRENPPLFLDRVHGARAPRPAIEDEPEEDELRGRQIFFGSTA